MIGFGSSKLPSLFFFTKNISFPSDALLPQYAEHTYTYRFPGVKDSDESFNAPIYARIVLVPRKAATVKAMLDDMDEALSVPMAMA